MPGKAFTFRGFLSPDPLPVIQIRCLILHPFQLSSAEDQWKQPGDCSAPGQHPPCSILLLGQLRAAAARAASGEEKPGKAEPSSRLGTASNTGWTGRDHPSPESCWGVLSSGSLYPDSVGYPVAERQGHGWSAFRPARARPGVVIQAECVPHGFPGKEDCGRAHLLLPPLHGIAFAFCTAVPGLDGLWFRMNRWFLSTRKKCFLGFISVRKILFPSKFVFLLSFGS